MESQGKQKLTLSISPEIVEKAKKLGINISKITEGVLGSIANLQEESIVRRDKLLNAYDAFFKQISKQMSTFNAPILLIGSEQLTPEGEINRYWYVRSDGTYFFQDEFEQFPSNNKKLDEIPISAIDGPDRILNRFIEEVYSTNESNKARLRDLKLFTRIFEVIAETNEEKQKPK